jgi:hypothetical protein
MNEEECKISSIWYQKDFLEDMEMKLLFRDQQDLKGVPQKEGYLSSFILSLRSHLNAHSSH